MTQSRENSWSEIRSDALSTRQLGLVFGLAFIVRLGVVLMIMLHPERAIYNANPTSLYNDSVNYLVPAWNMVTHGVFSAQTSPPFTPDSWRTPGYPLLLSLFMLIGGPKPFEMVVIAQTIIGAFTAVGAALLGTRLVSARCGLWAGLIAGMAPANTTMVGFIMTETWFAAWLMIAAWFTVRGLQDRVWSLCAVGGLAYGFATLIRPIGIVLLPALALVPLILQPPKQFWKYSLSLLAGFMIVAGAWMARNSVQFGRFALASHGDSHLLYYSVAGVESRRTGLAYPEVREKLQMQAAQLPDRDSRWAYDREGRLARQIILERPMLFAIYTGLDDLKSLEPNMTDFERIATGRSLPGGTVGRLLKGDPASAVNGLSTRSGFVVAGQLYIFAFTLVLILFSLCGSVVLLVRRCWLPLWVLAVMPFLLLYAPGYAANARFRAPLEPILAILAAVALDALVTRLRVFFR